MTTAQSRYRSLDGLRGIAAFVVLVSHALVVQPTLALSYSQHDALPGWATALSYTPLHILWAGGEAVIVFFVLSGFVLTLGAAQGLSVNWRAYYPRRFVRLYVPVAVAVLLVTPVNRFLRPTRPSPDDSWWMNMHVGGGGLKTSANDMLLLRHPGSTMTPLWSLEWEVIFSLLLPVYLLLFRVRSARVGGLVGVAATIASCIGCQLQSGPIQYLPVFVWGVLIAQHRVTLAEWGSRHWQRLLPIGCVALVLHWTLVGNISGHRADSAVLFGVEVLGAVGIVVAFLAGALADRVARSTRVQWLGRVSFSLYLVHEPIVVGVANALGGHPPVLLQLVVAIPVSLVAAAIFSRAVEQPAHDLARRAGRMGRDRRGPAALPARPVGP